MEHRREVEAVRQAERGEAVAPDAEAAERLVVGSAREQVGEDGGSWVVRVDRKEQTAFSDHLAYNPDTEVAILTGNVVIHSKDNTYKGARAELDLQKDISRLLPAPGQRVFTTINPKNDDDNTDAGTQPAPVTQ